MQIAAIGDDPRLVECGPQLDSIVERLVDDACVVDEPVGHVGIEPPAAVVERGRQVPVVERRHRLDAGFEQLVDEPLVEPETARVDAPAPLGQHAPHAMARPRLQAERDLSARTPEALV
jgi:hypothetical protein